MNDALRTIVLALFWLLLLVPFTLPLLKSRRRIGWATWTISSAIFGVFLINAFFMENPMGRALTSQYALLGLILSTIALIWWFFQKDKSHD